MLFPLAVGALFAHAEAALVAVDLGGAFVTSFWLTLLGRLCGAFIGGDAEVELGAAAPLAEDTSGSAGPAPGTGGPAARPRNAEPAAPPESALPPLPTPAPPLAPPRVSAVPAPPVAAGPAVPAAVAAPLPPLTDAEARVEMARSRFDSDPRAGLDALGELRSRFAPHPLVLTALAELSRRAGDVPRATEFTREGIAVCLAVGETEAAARLLAAAAGDLAQIMPTLSGEQTLTLAGELKPLNELRLSARLYAAVLRDERSEIRAIKGLLQIAEMLLREPGEEGAASKIYRYVLDTCPDSPLATFAEEGLSRLQHRGAMV